MFRSYSFLPFFVVALSGCVSNEYEIELTPQGEKIQRKITVSRHESDKLQAFPPEELKRIADAYGAEFPEKPDQKHKFASVFRDKMPSDVGGKGSYIHWETSLGSTSAYVERFRGNDDLLADVESRLAACDQLADHLMGWMESELKTEPGFPGFRKFLDKELRRDLKNLSLYDWSFQTVSKVDKPDPPEFLVRVGQYLAERSYLSPDELPRLARAIWEASRNDNPRPLLDFLVRTVASKLNVPADQPSPKSLKFLENLADLEASANAYFQETEAYRDLLKEWEREAVQKPDKRPPKPSQVLTGLLSRALMLWRHAPDQVIVKLNVPAEPVWTNGEWNSEAKQIRWTQRLMEADSHAADFPAMCYAVWSEPDTAAQTKFFGRVVLEGEALVDYGLWFRGLSEREAKEWEKFLASLKPGEGLAEQLKTFRFSHEPGPPEDSQPDGLAGEICNRLLQGLGDKAQ